MFSFENTRMEAIATPVTDLSAVDISRVSSPPSPEQLTALEQTDQYMKEVYGPNYSTYRLEGNYKNPEFKVVVRATPALQAMFFNKAGEALNKISTPRFTTLI